MSIVLVPMSGHSESYEQRELISLALVELTVGLYSAGRTGAAETCPCM